MAFPCVDQLEQRTQKFLQSFDGGPEPSYSNPISGYSLYQHNEPFLLDHGGILPKFEIAYETWGELNEDKSNAILLHTGLSASSHAKSHPQNTTPGWWEKFIGPGLAIDTNRFHVICTNVIGGCYGSTGPSSIDPKDGKPYATRFPIVTIFDMVRAQFEMLDAMGIKKLHASVGASMGGMQSLAAALLFKDRISKVISISAAARSHPYSIALRFTQRQVLMADPNWNKGFYYDKVPPHSGMKLAREIATISYRSGPEWEQRFGRKRSQPTTTPSLCADFLIETYLDHQGERFCLQYDPNSLLYVSKAMDMFDLSASVSAETALRRARNTLRLQEGKGSSAPENAAVPPEEEQQIACSTVNAADVAKNVVLDDPKAQLEDLQAGLSVLKDIPTLILGIQSDILFPVWQQKEVADCLRQTGNKTVTYYELDSMYGHDAFLLEIINVGSAVKGHLELK
ncbi:homoserine O-acetyltransferase [Lobosporangium transversale]|uniref:Homoserine O-acetyltransferase n=1 Tax=Lobosporangium transversale TaxID=64571 RepID=A0A1Y2GW40_9FUNG|nr:homoserine O-acetyltransferase [Lobosporangium transversale]ORZ26518.1 homoserine O-acetyltransferase [Lobosporangium transversale]|eukprot:XP_021884283.1 homoserine O-acetyltransferase [Lobosporangium transversale]